MSSSNGTNHGNDVPLLIGGKDVHSVRKFPVHSPRTGHVWDASGATREDAINAVEAAQAAHPAWASTVASIRRDILLRVAEIFKGRSDELVELQRSETGAGEELFLKWTLSVAIEDIKEVAGKCSMVIGSIPTPFEEGRGSFVLKEPYGVILGTAPW